MVNWHLAGEQSTLPVWVKIAVLIPIKFPFESSRGPPLSKIQESLSSLMSKLNICGGKLHIQQSKKGIGRQDLLGERMNVREFILGWILD